MCTSRSNDPSYFSKEGHIHFLGSQTFMTSNDVDHMPLIPFVIMTLEPD